jgi:hypothetical protein
LQALQVRRIKVCTLDSIPRLRDCAATAAAVVRLELVEPSVVLLEASAGPEAGMATTAGSGSVVQRLKATPGAARALLAWAAVRASSLRCHSSCDRCTSARSTSHLKAASLCLQAVLPTASSAVDVVCYRFAGRASFLSAATQDALSVGLSRLTSATAVDTRQLGTAQQREKTAEEATERLANSHMPLSDPIKVCHDDEAAGAE